MAWGIGSPYVHYPVTWQGKTCIRLDRNPDLIAYGWPSISEADGYHLSINPGDRIVFKAKIWAGTSTTGDTGYLAGAAVGMDFYGANGRIVEINTPSGITSYPTWPPERELCYTPWSTTQWKQVTIDFIVQDSYIADPDGAYPAGTMVTPTAFIPWVHTFTYYPATEAGSIYFTDTELYVCHPGDPDYATCGSTSTTTSTGSCLSGETPITDSCPSGQTCCCSGTAQTQLKIRHMNHQALDPTKDDKGQYHSPEEYASLYDLADIGRWQKDYVVQVKQYKPDFKALFYWNVRTIDFAVYPELVPVFVNNEWVLKDAYENICQDDIGYAVDIGNPQVQSYLADLFEYVINDLTNYDGVLLDWGIATVKWEAWWGPINTCNPTNPRTGTNWTDEEVRQAYKGLYTAIKNKIGSKLLAVNGVGTGHYFNSSRRAYYEDFFKNSPLDGVYAELHWYFVNQQWYTEHEWLESLELLIWMQDNFLSGHPEKFFASVVKISDWDAYLLPLPSGATREQMAIYAFASTLLGAKSAVSSQIYFSTFMYGSFNLEVVKPLLNSQTQLGGPTNDVYRISGTHVYARDFSNGKVLVNPTDTSYQVTLSETYKTLTGTPLNSLTMQPHMGVILLKV
jgi:hypothetical protein